MKKTRAIPAKLFLCLLALMLIPAANLGCSAQNKGPMLDQGTVDLDTPDFTLTLVRSSQTVAALKPKGADGFDFTPGDLLNDRSRDGYFHLGDLELRLRTGNSGAWKNYSTAAARKPVTANPASRYAGVRRSHSHAAFRLSLFRSRATGSWMEASWFSGSR